MVGLRAGGGKIVGQYFQTLPHVCHSQYRRDGSHLRQYGNNWQSWTHIRESWIAVSSTEHMSLIDDGSSAECGVGVSSHACQAHHPLVSVRWDHWRSTDDSCLPFVLRAIFDRWLGVQGRVERLELHVRFGLFSFFCFCCCCFVRWSDWCFFRVDPLFCSVVYDDSSTDVFRPPFTDGTRAWPVYPWYNSGSHVFDLFFFPYHWIGGSFLWFWFRGSNGWFLLSHVSFPLDPNGETVGRVVALPIPPVSIPSHRMKRKVKDRRRPLVLLGFFFQGRKTRVEGSTKGWMDHPTNQTPFRLLFHVFRLLFHVFRFLFQTKGSMKWVGLMQRRTGAHARTMETTMDEHDQVHHVPFFHAPPFTATPSSPRQAEEDTTHGEEMERSNDTKQDRRHTVEPQTWHDPRVWVGYGSKKQKTHWPVRPSMRSDHDARAAKRNQTKEKEGTKQQDETTQSNQDETNTRWTNGRRACAKHRARDTPTKTNTPGWMRNASRTNDGTMRVHVLEAKRARDVQLHRCRRTDQEETRRNHG